MDRFIDGIEWLAAFFVGIVALDIFLSVLLRYLFCGPIPDSYDFGRLLLGILIFWGIAATSYRGGHITVDLVWAAVGPRGSARSTSSPRWCCCSSSPCRPHAVRQGARHLRGPCADLRSASADLAVLRRGLAGDVSAVVLIAIRTFRLIFQPEKDPDADRRRSNEVEAMSRRCGRRHRLRRAVRADAAARAGRHGDGPGRRRRLWLLVGASPALKLIGQTSMRTVTDYSSASSRCSC